MLRIIKKQGFTLIELMVVIVIIGVLASLAIPRFSEASDKAKVAEAPRILASFESAYLATKAEVGEASSVSITEGDIIFNVSAVNGDSKWFSYAYDNTEDVTGLEAQPQGKIGKITATDKFYNSYVTSGEEDRFIHCFSGSDYGIGRKYVPNFLKASNECEGI
jgi:prepilin-type N-terminal cleavage/methylation domain-containing protein